jgi:serine/threonine-protein kinase
VQSLQVHNRDPEDPDSVLRSRQKLGKYRIEKRLSNGPLAAVYRAYDTIHGVRVALKIPHRRIMDEYFLQDYRKEARLAAKLEHPNILPIQNADFIGSYFVISMPLGDETLGDRLSRRISTRKCLDFTQQILSAVAHAHGQRIIHCDLKPENFILFGPDRLRLTDFGFAKLARGRIEASGSGTVGYVAPEQAMGRPMLQSDVFSIGLILYRMFSGTLPSWPYDWPPPAFGRLRQKLHGNVIGIIRKAMTMKPAGRYPDAIQMLQAFERIRRRTARGSRRAS